MVLDGRIDSIETPAARDNPFADPDGDGNSNEIPTSLVDFMEFYLLNYFKPAVRDNGDIDIDRGFNLFNQIGCASCHVQNLTINRDRRVADVETGFNLSASNPLNRLFSTATAFINEVSDSSGFPTQKRPAFGSFVVRNIFTDFKRHDLGPNFSEINYDGTLRREFLTMALWGVGTTTPYGHDGRSPTLQDVIRRHGGEAQVIRDRFASLSLTDQNRIINFLQALVIFPPDDTSSNLDPANPATLNFPQFGHGSIKLTVLFNDPTDIE